MSRSNRDGIVSCFECAALAYCYGAKVPDLSREEGRIRAQACLSLRKGPTTETVAVAGREKGMSRKKAERMVSEGRARWVAKKTVQLLDEQSAT